MQNRDSGLQTKFKQGFEYKNPRDLKKNDFESDFQ